MDGICIVSAAGRVTQALLRPMVGERLKWFELKNLPCGRLKHTHTSSHTQANTFITQYTNSNSHTYVFRLTNSFIRLLMGESY